MRCKDIAWAVLDSGIERDHPAFRDGSKGKSRIKKTLDFSQFRQIVSLSNKHGAAEEEPAKRWRRDRPNAATGDADRVLEASWPRMPRMGRRSTGIVVEKLVEVEPDAAA